MREIEAVGENSPQALPSFWHEPLKIFVYVLKHKIWQSRTGEAILNFRA